MLRTLFCLVFAAALAVFPALAQAPIQVEHGWARATPGKSTTAAAYVSIASGDDDRLVAFTSPLAEQVQLHEDRTENGIARMRQLDGIAIHAGERLVFKPNGLHLMLIGLKQPLAAGQNVPLTLTFAKAGVVETQILVRKLGSADGGEAMPGMHM
jgi:copper(I)-binding protein